MSLIMRIVICLAVTGLIVTGCSQQQSSPTTYGDQALAGLNNNGNGAPSGAHYNLNIIGVPKEKKATMDDNNGHRIFVKLWGKAKIQLAEGPDFQVLDANGTDGNGAKFQLPDPDPDDDLIAAYTVYARALGKQNQWSTSTTCYTDSLGDTYCSGDTLYLERTQGKQKFEDVSTELLSLYLDVDGDGIPEQVGLFDDDTYDYFWDYDNHGLKLAQLRFYPVETDLTR